jgi:hypothetical protein
MRVILDSNILLSALLSPYGPPHRIYQAWRRGRFEPVTSGSQLVPRRRSFGGSRAWWSPGQMSVPESGHSLCDRARPLP